MARVELSAAWLGVEAESVDMSVEELVDGAVPVVEMLSGVVLISTGSVATFGFAEVGSVLSELAGKLVLKGGLELIGAMVSAEEGSALELVGAIGLVEDVVSADGLAVILSVGGDCVV